MLSLKRGINLGGYLSQCVHTKEHYDSFIHESDIREIASWGFDHVRLPIDYNVMEEEDGSVKEDGLAYVEKVIEWCDRYNLNLILDLHKAFGYDFNNAGDAEKNNLFTNDYAKKRFVDLWIRMAKRYGTCDHVAFELLNEVVEENNAQVWNELIAQAVTAIRANGADRPIIYGGIQWNSANTLKYLDIPEDKNIIFTFHFYEPLLFTHQKAHWVPALDPNMTVNYPDTMENFRKNSAVLGYQGEAVIKATAETMGTEFITEMVSEAVRAANAAGVSLYCGEFGVIDQAPVPDTLRWFTDVEEVFAKYDIGCSVWSYKLMDFGLISGHYDDIKDDLMKLWAR